MSEQTAVAESVTSTDVPVAVDPAQLNKPVHPSAQDDSSDLLKHKLGLANTHARAAEKRAKDAEAQLTQFQTELAELKNAQTAATQKSLESQGQFKQLW